MEAHASTTRIPAATTRTPATTKPQRRRLRSYLAASKARRRQRALRAHAIRTSGISAPSIPGSEHTHLLSRRGF